MLLKITPPWTETIIFHRFTQKFRFSSENFFFSTLLEEIVRGKVGNSLCNEL